jgi:hypothetical protein
MNDRDEKSNLWQDLLDPFSLTTRLFGLNLGASVSLC